MIRWKDFECELQSSYKDGNARIIETDYKLMNYNVDSNGIRVTIRDGGQDYALTSEDTVSGFVLCVNGQTFQAETKGKDGNKAWFIVPPDVYYYPGPCIVTIMVVTGEVKSIALAARMSVERVVTLPVLTPTSIVADITNIDSLLQLMEDAKQDALDAAAFLPNTIASEYEINQPYNAGDYFTDSGTLYRVISDITAQDNTGIGVVDKVAVTVGDELLGIINNIPIATVEETESYLGI